MEKGGGGMKKIMKNLQNQKGSIMLESIIVISVLVVLVTIIVKMITGGFETPSPEFGEAQAEQTATAEAESLDVFSQMAKDVESYKADAGYMTTDERQATGYGLLERLDVLLEQAEIAGNQTVVEQILSQQLTVENEMNYGL